MHLGLLLCSLYLSAHALYVYFFKLKHGDYNHLVVYTGELKWLQQETLNSVG